MVWEAVKDNAPTLGDIDRRSEQRSSSLVMRF
jgi:hypothetical protein